MTGTTIEYALMAGNAYQATTGDSNLIPIPDNWQPLEVTELRHEQDAASGFEATAYQKDGSGGPTEIVISFAGTNPNVPISLKEPDWWANAYLYLGTVDAQLKAAAVYYERIKNAYAGQNIEVTLQDIRWAAGSRR